MPKRKRSKALEEDVGYLRHKLRKLERQIQKRKSSDSSDSEDSLPEEVHVRSIVHRPDTPQPDLDPFDWQPEISTQNDNDNDHVTDLNADENLKDIPAANSNEETSNDPTSELKTTEEVPSTSSDEPRLDDDALKILGEDPSVSTQHGPDIHKELASRMQHIAQEGLTKVDRKDLVEKYPLPANCLLIGAPAVNPEIKGALPDPTTKRDKGIELKQKQMASAISCLGQVLTDQLRSKERNNDVLQKLMDLGRILCDIQHGDSVARRNFVLFHLKKDMKEHLTNTKIDSLLFSEKLSDTLKTAKAVNKSGVELLAESGNKNPQTRRTKAQAYKPLNQRAPAPARRQPGPQQRSRLPAAQRAPQYPRLPPTQPYRTSYYAPLPALPPPPPPPPPAPQARRRY